MATHETYPQYQASGVPWLGEIPAHWEVKRLKNVATYNDETIDEKTDPDYKIEYVDISSVSLANGIERSETLKFEKSPSRARRKIAHGDIIVSTVRTYLKAIAPICNPPENMIVSTGFAVIRPVQNFHSGYAGYLLQSNGFVGDVVANSFGVSYPAINASDLVRIPIPIPPLQEQQAIAAFLEAQTARIDALVAKNKLLLAKLQEQRSALISRAVTKGLRPAAPQRDSGVAWLGEIPAHWEVKRLKFVARIQNGCDYRHVEISDNTKGFPVYGSGGIFQKASTYLYAGDSVLFGRKGTIDKPLFATGKFWIVDTMFYSEISDDVVAKFLFYYAKIIPYKMLSTQTALPSIAQNDLSNSRIPFPPLHEQQAIAAFLDAQTAQIDALQKKITAVMDRLSEYRCALIANAVTGKIDIRNKAGIGGSHAQRNEF